MDRPRGPPPPGAGPTNPGAPSAAHDAVPGLPYTIFTKDFIVAPATGKVFPPMPQFSSADQVRLAVRMFSNREADERGLDIVMCHATGIPKACYYPLVSHLFSKLGYNLRSIILHDVRNHSDSALLNADLLPSTNPPPFDWTTDCVEDWYGVIRAFGLDKKGKGVVGIGHSLGGAVLAMVQIKYPVFSELVLIEPVLFQRAPYSPRPGSSTQPSQTQKQPDQQPSQAQKDKNAIPASGRASMAAKRRSTFPSLDAALSAFQSRPFFKTWNRTCLDLYVSHGLTQESNNEWRLKTSPEQEAATFAGGLDQGFWWWDRLTEIEARTVVITGRNSHHLNMKFDGKDGVEMPRDLAVASLIPSAQHIFMESASHMVPQDFPAKTADLITNFLVASLPEREAPGPDPEPEPEGMAGDGWLDEFSSKL